MATSLTIQAAQAKLQWEYSNVLDWGNAVNSAGFSYAVRLTNGNSASQADRLYVAQGTIAASGSATFDVHGTAGTPLLDMFGNTVTLARVKIIYVELLTTTAASSLLVGGGSNPLINWIGTAGDQVRVRNGGAFILVAPDATGYAVTGATADILTIANQDASLVAYYKLGIVGSTV